MGLNPPQVVLDATQRYFETEDAFTSWLEECCVEIKGTFTTRKALFESYSTWMLKAGENPGGQKYLVQAMESRGFQHHKSDGNRGFLGISVKAGEHPNDPRQSSRYDYD